MGSLNFRRRLLQGLHGLPELLIQKGTPDRIRNPNLGEKRFCPGPIPTEPVETIEGREGRCAVIGGAVKKNLGPGRGIHFGQEGGEVGGLGSFEGNGDMAIDHAGRFDETALVGEAIRLAEKPQVDDAFEAGGAKGRDGFGRRLSGGGEEVGYLSEGFDGIEHEAPSFPPSF